MSNRLMIVLLVVVIALGGLGAIIKDDVKHENLPALSNKKDLLKSVSDIADKRISVLLGSIQAC